MSGISEARAVARRSLSALGRGSSARAAQVIVKRVSGARTARDGCRMAEYVARLGEFAAGRRDGDAHAAGEGRGDPRPRLFDEFGAEVARADVVGTMREGWGLMSAQENRSPAARLRDDLAAGARLVEQGGAADAKEAHPGGPAGGDAGRWWIQHGGRRRRVDGRVVGRLLAMGVLQREDGGVVLRHGVTLPADEETARPQVHHFVFSVPVGERGKDVARLEEAVREVVRDAFAERGHRALWAVHVDHGKRPHAHVLVQARNEWGEHLGTAAADMDVLRSRLADAATAAGLRVEATRRADRPELVADIIRGEAVLRPRLGRQDYRDGLQGWERPAREMARLAARVPAWLDGKHGQAFVRRLSGAKAVAREEGWLERWRKRREGAADSPVAGRLREMGVFMVGGMDGTAEAMRAFEAMRQEDDALARWYLCHRPVAFAAVDPAVRIGRDLGLRSLVRQLPRASVGQSATPDRAGRRGQGPDIAGGGRAIAADLVRVTRSHVALARREEAVFGDDDRRFGDALERAAALRDQAARLQQEMITAEAARRRVERLRVPQGAADTGMRPGRPHGRDGLGGGERG